MNPDVSPPPVDLSLALAEAEAACRRALADAADERRKREELEEAVRNRDAVLSVVAHDLRNPLNIISLAANTILQQLPEGTPRRTAERILRSAQRADRMIRDLLTVSAIETGRFAIDAQPVETAELILGALESQFSLATAASIIVAADVSPELPPVHADEQRLLDVLENLISNAVKFTAPGGSITVGASRRGAEVLIWVKDSGFGIPAEQLPYIFDRFWQAKKKERRGMGLGLSICKATVEAHGGRIWAESVVGLGTTVFFTLPAAAGSQAPLGSGEIAKVLLVDDRPENLLSLKAILERPDYQLVSAKSGEEALALALKHRFAVVLLDIAMPGMNGLEVAIHLKGLERSRDIPIIFVTAFGDDPEEIHRAYSSGAADYLVKPLDPEIVRKKVAVFVDLSRRQWRGEQLRAAAAG
jgi:CheY-like chemotaxis protein